MFHDVTTGNNIVTVACSRRQPELRRHCGGILRGRGLRSGHRAGVGGCLQAGDGMEWREHDAAAASPTASVKLLSNLSTVAANDVVYLTATVTSTEGTTPSGSVLFSIGGSFVGSAVLTGSAGTATATLGGERPRVAVGQWNDYGNLRQHQQRVGGGQRDASGSGSKRDAGRSAASPMEPASSQASRPDRSSVCSDPSSRQ